MKISGTFLVALLLAGIFTGALANGDRVRANYHTDSNETADDRINWVKSFLLIVLPNALFINSGLSYIT